MKKIIILILTITLVLSITNGFSQVPQVKTYDYNDDSKNTSIEGWLDAPSDMNYIFASPSKPNWQVDRRLAAITRLEDDLSIDWTKLYGIDDNEIFDHDYSIIPNDVIILSTGKFAICGGIEIDGAGPYGFILLIDDNGANPMLEYYPEVSELTSIVEQH